MKKEFVNNIGLITLLVSTLFFIKMQMINNAAYASFQRSFSFLINVIIFISLIYIGYLLYNHFIAKKGSK